MIDSKTAQEALKLWALLDRAKKVGFKAPAHWYRYGDPPKNTRTILEYNMAAFVGRMKAVFESDDMFYKIIGRRK